MSAAPHLQRAPPPYPEGRGCLEEALQIPTVHPWARTLGIVWILVILSLRVSAQDVNEVALNWTCLSESRGEILRRFLFVFVFVSFSEA